MGGALPLPIPGVLAPSGARDGGCAPGWEDHIGGAGMQAIGRGLGSVFARWGLCGSRRYYWWGRRRRRGLGAYIGIRDHGGSRIDHEKVCGGGCAGVCRGDPLGALGACKWWLLMRRGGTPLRRRYRNFRRRFGNSWRSCWRRQDGTVVGGLPRLSSTLTDHGPRSSPRQLVHIGDTFERPLWPCSKRPAPRCGHGRSMPP